jgi:predicted dehydrogenase
MMADKDIEIILNLTIPQAHTEINLRALESGKSTYCEKPFALNMDDAKKVLDLANEKGLLTGCAPDTFMGAGIQTCKKIIEDGVIGEPIAATAFMTCHGHESWHPSPEFYYQKGGGPLLDMGPYYLTTLLNLIGPIKRVSGSGAISFPQRTITSEPKNGKVVDVEVFTHVSATLEFENGAIGTLITSFDVWAANLPRIEIYGTKGSLSVPDPNTFDGAVKVKVGKESDWEDIALTHGYNENSRGYGLCDMALALRSGETDHRASGQRAAHVLNIMLGIIKAAETGTYQPMEIPCTSAKSLSAK